MGWRIATYDQTSITRSSASPPNSTALIVYGDGKSKLRLQKNSAHRKNKATHDEIEKRRSIKDRASLIRDRLRDDVRLIREVKDD